jgi:nucleoside-diphosphate-sugar epimerase
MLISNAEKMMQDKHLFVIGGTDFFGFHFVNYLLNSAVKS